MKYNEKNISPKRRKSRIQTVVKFVCLIIRSAGNKIIKLPFNNILHTVDVSPSFLRNSSKSSLLLLPGEVSYENILDISQNIFYSRSVKYFSTLHPSVPGAMQVLIFIMLFSSY